MRSNRREIDESFYRRLGAVLVVAQLLVVNHNVEALPGGEVSLRLLVQPALNGLVLIDHELVGLGEGSAQLHLELGVFVAVGFCCDLLLELFSVLVE